MPAERAGAFAAETLDEVDKDDPSRSCLISPCDNFWWRPTYRIPSLPILVGVIAFQNPFSNMPALLDHELFKRVAEMTRGDPSEEHLDVGLRRMQQQARMEGSRCRVAVQI